MSWSEIPVALLAGFLSFLAPCVLPLVPGYLSTVSAVSAEELGRPGNARRVVTSSIPFVLGFTAFFVLLGVGASLLGGSLFRDQFLLEEIAGFVLVVFGLAFMGLLPWPERLVGAGLVQGARSRGSRVLLGGAFAVCAAPCIGPVLAAILVLAGSSDGARGCRPARGVPLDCGSPSSWPARFSRAPWVPSAGCATTIARPVRAVS
jgi:cytochrome c-type biogenesis protein